MRRVSKCLTPFPLLIPQWKPLIHGCISAEMHLRSAVAAFVHSWTPLADDRSASSSARMWQWSRSSKLFNSTHVPQKAATHTVDNLLQVMRLMLISLHKKGKWLVPYSWLSAGAGSNLCCLATEARVTERKSVAGENATRDLWSWIQLANHHATQPHTNKWDPMQLKQTKSIQTPTHPHILHRQYILPDARPTSSRHHYHLS